MLGNVVAVIISMCETVDAFLMPFWIGIGVEIKIGIYVALKGCKCRVIGSGRRRCLLHIVVFFEFFNEINNGWGGFVLPFLANEVYF